MAPPMAAGMEGAEADMGALVVAVGTRVAKVKTVVLVAPAAMAGMVVVAAAVGTLEGLAAARVAQEETVEERAVLAEMAALEVMAGLEAKEVELGCRHTGDGDSSLMVLGRSWPGSEYSSIHHSRMLPHYTSTSYSCARRERRSNSENK